MRWENIIFISLNLLFSSRVETENPGALVKSIRPLTANRAKAFDPEACVSSKFRPIGAVVSLYSSD